MLAHGWGFSFFIFFLELILVFRPLWTSYFYFACPKKSNQKKRHPHACPSGSLRCSDELAGCELGPVWCNDLRVHIRDPQMTQNKAQSEVNGCSLNKGCNAGLGHLWASLRARRVAIICGVTSLGKGMPFPAKRALQLMATRLADMYT